MWKVKKKNAGNELIYKTEIKSQMQRANLWLPRGIAGRDKFGELDQNVHITIYKVDQ